LTLATGIEGTLGILGDERLRLCMPVRLPRGLLFSGTGGGGIEGGYDEGADPPTRGDFGLIVEFKGCPLPPAA